MEKRVLELTGEPIGMGGQEMFIINVIKHMNHDGLQIDLLTPYHCENLQYENEILKHGGQLFCLNLPFNARKSRNNIIIPIYKFLKKNKYDVVHIHSGSISVLAYSSFISRLIGIKKIIVHSHSAGLKKNFRYKLLKAFSFPLITWSPTDYCACSELAGIWKYPKSVVRNKLIIIKNGVDLNLFAYNEHIRKEIRDQFHLENKTIVIGHVGRFSYQKNQEFIIRLVAMLKKRSFNCKAILIGEGESLDMVKELVHNYELNESVFFVNRISNVSDYMQAMDIFILPSRWEGLPIVGVEAQAAGLPIIVSEKVTEEMKLVENVTYLDINNEKEWVKTIIEMKIKRYSNSEKIKEKGYDINDTSKFVRKLYLK